MLSRRDLIQSRQYLRQRQVRALLAHRPDPLDWAGRHSFVTAFAGVMILVIALAAAAIIGLVFPGGSNGWQSCQVVIVERDTGATFVCDATSRTLYPVANFSSAALIVGASTSVRVARASLTWPRGALLGLPGAPDDLVPPANYLTGAWSLCSVARPDAAGRRTPATVILAGARPDAAQELGGRAVLLVGPDGTRYLLWSGHRYPIRDPTFVLPALGFSASEGVAVGDAWLAPVPLGATLGPIDVPGAGAGLPRFPRAKVGQLVRVAAADGTGRVYLVRPEGLQEVTELQQALVRTSGAVIIAVEPTDLAGTTIVAPMSLPGFAAPAEVPAFARPSTEDTLVCAVMIADQVDIVINGQLPMRAASVVARRVSGRDGVPLADEVLVEPGHAVLARSLAGPQVTGGPLLLVTDLGIRHSCGSAEVPGMLGFPAGSTPVPLPAALLARVTEGVALDPAKARLALPGS